MAEPREVPQTNRNGKEGEKYYKFQIRGWLNFDPADKTLANVAERVEVGDGFIGMVDLLKVADDVAAIDDEEVREAFENLLAAKRLIQNAGQLPAKLIEELRAALKLEQEIAPKNNVTPISSSLERENPEIQIVSWP